MQSAKCCRIHLWSYLILHVSLPLQMYANAMDRTPQSELFDYLPTSIILTMSWSAGLNKRLAINLIVLLETLEYMLSYTLTTPSPHPMLETVHQWLPPTKMICTNSPPRIWKERVVNCRILQAGYVWEFLQEEQLSSFNHGVQEPAKNFLFVTFMRSVQWSGQPVIAYSCKTFVRGHNSWVFSEINVFNNRLGYATVAHFQLCRVTCHLSELYSGCSSPVFRRDSHITGDIH